MATINAASVSAADVQTAINSASDGDTVLVPSGSATWSTAVSCTKGIKIQGAGIDVTTITDGTTGGWMDEPLIFCPKVGYTTDISGFTFDGQNSATSSWGMVCTWADYAFNAGTFRIHHNKFKNIKIRGIGAWKFYGLIDHNTFLAPYDASAQAVAVVGDGMPAYRRAYTPGTANAVYFEDNVFTFDYPNDGCLDAYRGARFVFRHNVITNAEIGWHGFDSGGADYPAVHTWEVYENDFAASLTMNARGFYSRGGTGVVFNNRFVNTGAGTYAKLVLVNYRSAVGFTIDALDECDGDSVWDGNEVGGQGYHCAFQNGWTGDGANGDEIANQILAPIYAWGNTIDGAPVGLSVYDGADR
jgi:hypothetical protein